MFFELRDRRPSGRRLLFTAYDYIPKKGTLFPLHDSCVAIAQEVISQHRTKRPDLHQLSNLAMLYKLLLARFKSNWDGEENLPQIRLTNDVLDLCSRSLTYGPRSVVALELREWWNGDFKVSIRRLASPSHWIPNRLCPGLTNANLEILHRPSSYTRPHAFRDRYAPKLSSQRKPLYTSPTTGSGTTNTRTTAC
jgi:hypothetical protein